MKINKLFLMAFVASLSLGFTSCSDDDDYSAGPEVGTTEVTFDNESNIVLGLDDTDFTVTVTRADGTNALTVPIEVVSAPPTVTVPETVTFAAGETTKDITISAGDGVEPFVKYFLVLAIPTEYAANTYKADPDTYPRFNVTVLREDYKPWATCVFAPKNFYNPYKTLIEYSEMLDLYRMPDLFSDGYPWFFKWDGKSGDDQTFYIADENGNKITKFFSGLVHPTYGNVMANILSKEDTGYMGWYEEYGEFVFGCEYTVSAGSFGDVLVEIGNIEKY